jgi:hypothetical protein
MLLPTKLRCILLSYAAPSLSYAAPSELSLAAFWATLNPTELRLTLNELLGTLKNIMSSAHHPAHRSCAVPFGEINIM